MTMKAFEKGNTLNRVAGGITVCLAGGMLIFLGDGHDSLVSKLIVVCGVVFTIVGIGILRYLMFQRKDYEDTTQTFRR